MGETRHTPGPSPMGMRAAEKVLDLAFRVAIKPLSLPQLCVQATQGFPINAETEELRRSVAEIIDRETAAPDLVAALEFYAAMGDGPDEVEAACDDQGARANAALRKARGE